MGIVENYYHVILGELRQGWCIFLLCKWGAKRTPESSKSQDRLGSGEYPEASTSTWWFTPKRLFPPWFETSLLHPKLFTECVNLMATKLADTVTKRFRTKGDSLLKRVCPGNHRYSRHKLKDTLPETNSSHLKHWVWKMSFLLGRHFSRC